MDILFSLALILAMATPPEAPPESPKVIQARITGYYAEPSVKSATGEKIRPGATAAVSRNCIFLLGEKVYVDQHGVFEVNDLTAAWVGEQFEICTVDLAQACPATARGIGNKIMTVVKISGEKL